MLGDVSERTTQDPPRREARPLVRAIRAPFVVSTYRRALHLLLGGVLLLPYVLLGELFSSTSPDAVGYDTTVLVGLVALAAAIGVGVTLVPAARSVEIVAARKLLGVDLPDPAPSVAGSWSVRLRSAAWYALSLLLGGVGTAVMVVALSVSIPLLISPATGQAPAWRVHLPDGPAAVFDHVVLGPVWAALVLLAGAYAVAGLGEVLVRAAPTALGPGPEEALALEQRTSRRLAAQARLAQQMHDTLGHALTAALRQAEAAARVLDTDPAFARRALEAVADVSRRALDDLDRVMALLRGDESAADLEPAATLADLGALLAAARAGGYAVTLEADDVDPAALPAVVSRTAWQVLREALTNAMRHGARAPIDVAMWLDDHDDALVVEVVNDVPDEADTADHPVPPARRQGGGRGLPGLAECCDVLGGRLSSHRDGRRWRLRAVLPLGAARDAS
jgi:signal transduction histidine kinase